MCENNKLISQLKHIENPSIIQCPRTKVEERVPSFTKITSKDYKQFKLLYNYKVEKDNKYQSYSRISSMPLLTDIFKRILDLEDQMNNKDINAWDKLIIDTINRYSHQLLEPQTNQQ